MFAASQSPFVPVHTSNLQSAKSDTSSHIGGNAEKLIQVTASQLCEKSGFSAADQDDIEQDLRVHLFIKSHKFNPDRASQTTFISRIIYNKAASMLRERRALKRRAPTVPCEKESFNKKHAPKEGVAKADNAELRIQVAEVISSLPRKLREAAKLLMTEGICDAAKILGVNRCSFSTWLIPKLEKAFKDAGFEPFFAEQRNIVSAGCVCKVHEVFKEPLNHVPREFQKQGSRLGGKMLGVQRSQRNRPK